MLRGYILVELESGKNIKYVRDVVKSGDPKNYYLYGDTIGDTYNYQGDTPGRIKYDFGRVVTLFFSRHISGVGNSMLWPESGGDTQPLVRTNLENATLSVNMPPGDSFFYKLLPKTRMTIDVDQITSISVIEERITSWYSGVPQVGKIL